MVNGIISQVEESILLSIELYFVHLRSCYAFRLYGCHKWKLSSKNAGKFLTTPTVNNKDKYKSALRQIALESL